MAREFAAAVVSTARTLWIGAYWDDERMEAYRERTGRGVMADYGRQMEEWPVPPLPPELVADVAEIVRDTERAWGRTFEEVAEAMDGRTADWLMYAVVMQSIGHGIGPDDDGDFPEGLDTSPVSTDDPAYRYTPGADDVSGIAEEVGL